MKTVLVLALLPALIAAPQARHARKPAPPRTQTERTSWPLASVRVEGNHNYTPQQILKVANLRAGQTVVKADFDAARERLIATGAFDSVGYRYAPNKDASGYDATFEIAEMAQVYPMRFEDLPAPDADIRAFLAQKDPLFAPKIPATQLEIDRYAAWIAEFLVERKHPVSVTGRLAPDVPPELTIVFRPKEPRPSVAYVKFTNTGDIPASLLQKEFYGVAIGSVYTEPNFRTLLDTTIRPLYEARGRIRVSFPKIAIEKATDVKGVSVTVQVEQGDVFKLAKVAFAGARAPGASPFDKLAKLKTGEAVNFDEVQAAKQRVEQSFQRNGYMRARLEVKRDVHDAAKTVDVTFEITPGPQFLFGKLDIAGLDITSEPVIRKMWGLAPGKPFNIDYPNHFLERVKDEGLFDNLKTTRSETQVHPEDNTVDVKLYFQ